MLEKPHASTVSRLKDILGEKNTLKRQLSFTFLAVGLIPLVFMSLVALWLTNNMAENLVRQNIEALKSNKVVAIEEYGKTIVNQVITASQDPNLAQNLKKLVADFEKVAQLEEKQETESSEQLSSEERTQAERLANIQKIEILRQDLAQYYNNQFLPTYRDANNGESVNTTQLLNSLSAEAVVLQHAYIQANPSPLGNKHEMFSSGTVGDYDNSHRLVHETFKVYLEKFGYYDIFLVDTKGRVVYSVYKELDFATNLLTGPYANSGLGEAFRQSLTLNNPLDYVLIDYAQYTPSYKAPASFISSPIFHDGARVGSLIYQMPLDAITAVMSEKRGLGATGESYLIGQDKLMRSDSLKFPEEYSVDASFRNERSVDSASIQAGLRGESGVIEGRNYKDESVVSGYIPVSFGSLRWVMIAEIETKEAFANVHRLFFIVGGICLIAIVFIIYLSMKVSKQILSPIEKMQTAVAEIATSTDFSQRVEIERDDEIGKSILSLNNLISSVEVSIQETNSVVTAMANGDFSQRVQADFKGDLLALKQGVNQSAQAIESSIKEVNIVVEALAAGDFTQNINIDLKGELKQLKDGVNSSSLAIGEAIMQLGKMMEAMSRGDFKYRVSSSLVGEYAKLASQGDRAMHIIDDALSEIDSAMSKVARGNIDARVNATLPGQLDTIKNNLNTSLAEISLVFSETEDLLGALAQGKLSVEITHDFPGRFNVLKQNANSTVQKLTEVVIEIQQAASTVQAGVDDIAQGNSDLSQRTELQASNLEKTASSMDEITTTVKHTASNANHANKIASEAKEQAQSGSTVVKEATSAMAEINQASGKIADIISVIDAIAFQTNLLALNAAVEAARAGEQGKGFAVVAGEVRNLAGRSANAAKEIKKLINDSVDKVETGTELVEKSGKTLLDIVTQVENVSAIVSEISTGAEQQSIGISEVHSSLESLQMLTQQNTAMVEEAAAGSEELGSQARSMGELIRFFSIK